MQMKGYQKETKWLDLTKLNRWLKIGIIHKIYIKEIALNKLTTGLPDSMEVRHDSGNTIIVGKLNLRISHTTETVL